MISFYKYHGTGNDFIMINNLKGDINLKPDYIKFLCDRHLGIGADGLILLEKSDKVDFFMNYYNSDGSIAEMCGNGIRCTAKFYVDHILGSPTSDNKMLSIDTRAGVKNIKINDDDTYSVNMGKPIFEHPDFPSAIGKAYGQIQDFNFNYVSMGNPHAVTFVKNLENIDIKSVGPKIENNSFFPNKINVEFVEKIDETNYKVKVWERGCGETLSCGTGACAIYAIIKTKNCTGLACVHRQDLCVEEIMLEFPGGKLYLSKDHEGNIILRGPAVFVFKGEII